MPKLTKENILGVNVGVRPCRKSGVRIEAEFVQDKVIIHNYGYGGSGLTLCFGGANEALNLLEQQGLSSRVVAIIGAGIIGLATAYDLLEKGFEVHLYSDGWSPHLTSNVAVGIWTPLNYSNKLSLEQNQFHQHLLEISENRALQSIGDNPEFAGVHFIETYSFRETGSQEKGKTRFGGEDVVVHFDNGVVKEGQKITRLGLEGQIYIEDVYNKVKKKGAVLKERHFQDLQDVLSLEEPVIINCTGMGSRELFNDQDLYPIRGQIIYFKPQKGVDYHLFQSIPHNSTNPIFWVSCYPWSDRIILNGVYEYGEEEAVNDSEILNTILENAVKALSENS